MKKIPLLEEIEEEFSVRIVTLVGYGSYFFNRAQHDESDVDLCLVLDTRKNSDLKHLKKIFINHEHIIDITVHYLDELEQRGWENFTHGTHGAFFLHHLAHSHLILGRDLFARKAQLIPHAVYQQSLISQIESYIDRIQQRIVFGTQKNDSYFYAKYFSRIMADMMLLDSSISFREINKCDAKELLKEFFSNSSLLNSESCSILGDIILTQKNTAISVERLLILTVKSFEQQLKSGIIN